MLATVSTCVQNKTSRIPNKVKITQCILNNDSGEISLSWELRRPAAVTISYSGPSNENKGSVDITTGTTSTVISGFVMLSSTVVYTITVQISGVSTIKDSTTVSVSGKVSVIAGGISSCILIASSRSGEYLLIFSTTAIYVYSNYGKTLLKTTYNSLPSWFISTAESSSTYKGVISDDGQLILVYSYGDSSARYGLSTDGATTFDNTKKVVSSGLNINSICMSASGDRIYATGNGTNGGIYLSTNRGLSFTKKVSTPSGAGCASCSDNGLVMAQALPTSAQLVTDDGGANFYYVTGPASAPITNVHATFVNPQGTAVVFLEWLSAAIWYTSYSSTSTVVQNLPRMTKNATSHSTWSTSGDRYVLLDRNNRFYGISGNKVKYREFADAAVTDSGYTATSTERRLVGSTDGRYLYFYTGSAFNRIVQWQANDSITSNTITLSSSGTLSGSWTVSSSVPTRLRWWPPTKTPYPSDYPAGTNISIDPVITGFYPSIYYTVTISTLTSDGKYITSVKEIKNLVSYIIKFSNLSQSRSVHYDPSDNSTILDLSNNVITTNNTLVYKVTDKSGNNNHLVSKRQTTSNTNAYLTAGLGASNSIYNKPCLKVINSDGKDGFMTTNVISAVNGVDTFVVYRPLTKTISGTDYAYFIVNKTSSSKPNPYDFYSTNVMIGNGTATLNNFTPTVFSTPTSDPAQAMLLNLVVYPFMNGTTSKVTVKVIKNSSEDPLPAASQTQDTNYTDNSSANVHFFGRIDEYKGNPCESGEIILFPSKLNPEERLVIEGYLARKWNIISDSAWYEHPYFHELQLSNTINS